MLWLNMGNYTFEPRDMWFVVELFNGIGQRKGTKLASKLSIVARVVMKSQTISKHANLISECCEYSHATLKVQNASVVNRLLFVCSR
jgi:hypothetical protein